MKPHKFKKLSDKKYIMDLGRVTIKYSSLKPTPYYPKVHRLQNRINSLLGKDRFLMARKYEKLKKKAKPKKRTLF